MKIRILVGPIGALAGFIVGVGTGIVSGTLELDISRFSAAPLVHNMR